MPTKDIAWVAWIHRGYGQFTIQIESDLKAGEKLAFSRNALARLLRFQQDAVGVWKYVDKPKPIQKTEVTTNSSSAC